MEDPKHTDVVIVGAGGGGGIVAKELAEAGRFVVLLERGEHLPYDPERDDELQSQRGPSLYLGYGPDDERYRRVLAHDPDHPRVVTPSHGGYGAITAAVGGGTSVYGAMAWRFMEVDFRLRSHYGDIEGAGLEDWPMTYEELEPYYTKAEWEIGVSGDDSGDPNAPRRSKPYPMPPFPYDKSGRIVEGGAKSLGWHPFPIPMARNSEVYGGRPPCIYRKQCVGFACPMQAKGGTQNTVLPKALATGNCELRTHAQVYEIVLDDAERVRGVRYFDREGKSRLQTADRVVISASAVETARLLLNSGTRRFPRGLGNNRDLVGRFLQNHHYTGASGLFEEEIQGATGPGASVAVADFNHHDPDLFGGGILANEFISLPVRFAGRRPPGEARWGKAHKDFQRRYFTRTLEVQGPIQELPVADCRVQVDAKVKDAWGVPVPRLSGSKHRRDLDAAEMLSRNAEILLREAGATRVWRRKNTQVRGASAGQHQAGTCRMGTDPANSVADRNGQVHEIENLYLADGSLLPNNGGYNPSLTIMAVSFWVADRIKESW